MQMNVTILRKSTERCKIQVQESSYKMLSLIALILQQKRKVDHSLCDALVVAMDTTTSLTQSKIRMLSKFYCKSDEDRYYVKVRKDVKEEIFRLAKQYRVSSEALIDSVITVYMRAVIASIWRDNKVDKEKLSDLYPDFIIQHNRAFLLPEKHRVKNFRTRKISTQIEQEIMRHHNYMEEFRQYMQQFGGIEKYLNQNVKLMIHARPLQGSIGKATDLDTPKDENPGCVYTARIWKRGRGYNITILQQGDSYGEDPPELETGTVFRLYDIYRNIDWFTLTI